ncbi:hypothetical protein [Tsukamurella paurometabola]|uniref:Scaffolding protein n=1 Tax=Tsukamurella paurometabola TaxID=2061 RepID=A0ABS5NI48_TSUPA|nr:hypothetical protein [Tsukamurella paurometabola]MBS4103966.1 hypothetical protein [Tsukamurella paurometabola]
MTDTAVEAPSFNADGLEVPTESGSAETGSQTLTEASSTPANREARYRVERNEARAERDALTERLTELQTREVLRLAAEHLAAPEDIGLSGNELSAYLTPEGWVDRAAVEAAAAAVIDSRPGLAKASVSPAYDPSQGTGGSGGRGGLSLGDVFKMD